MNSFYNISFYFCNPVFRDIIFLLLGRFAYKFDASIGYLVRNFAFYTKKVGYVL